MQSDVIGKTRCQDKMEPAILSEGSIEKIVFLTRNIASELKFKPMAVICAILAREQDHRIHPPLPGHREDKKLGKFPTISHGGGG